MDMHESRYVMSKDKHPAESDQPGVKNPTNPQYPTNDQPRANEHNPTMPAHQDRQGSKGGSPSDKKP